MKLWSVFGITALGLGVLSVGISSRTPAGAQSDPLWQSDFEAARKLSRETGKPLFVAFR